VVSTTRGKAAPLLHALSLSLVLQCVGLGLLTLAQLLIARLLGAGGFGVFSYATACATAAITFGKFGTDTLMYRRGGQYFANQEWGRFLSLFYRSRVLLLRASLAGCLGLGVFAWFIYLRKGDAILAAAIVVAALGVPIVASSTLRQAALISINETAKGLLPENLVRTTLLIGGALALGAAGISAPLPAVALNVLTYLVALMLGQYWLGRSAIGRAQTGLDSSEQSQWDSAARGLLLFSGAYQIVAQFDILLLGLLVDKTSIGLYASARQIASLGMLALFTFQIVASARIASAYSTGDRPAFSGIVDVVALSGAAFTFAYALFILVAGSWVLGLFGAEFAAGRSVLLWLIGAQVVNAIAGPAGTVVAMLGLHRAATFVYVFSAAFGSALLLILVPALGINGAAIAVVATTALWGIALNVLLYRRVGTTVWIGRIRGSESRG
jgi:O-antigen/teichoic acid export membrane protein